MKRTIPIILTILLSGCVKSGEELIGDWKVNSKFYQSTCHIQEAGGRLKGLVLTYNDGTSKYQYNGNNERYLFKNLKKSKGNYVDAVSGATPKDGETTALSIRVKSRDTIEMTTYTLDRPLTEIWTRK